MTIVAPTAMDVDEFLHVRRKILPKLVMGCELAVQYLRRKLARFGFIQNGDTRVEVQFVKMFPDKFQAETVQRAYVSKIESSKLLGPQVG